MCFTTFMIVQKITPHNFLLAFIDELWKTWQIRILKKWKKIAGDIIILHTCTANHNHMKYSSWDTKWHKFLLLFWVIFLAFWKNEKIHWIYHHFTQVYHKWQSCDIWFLRYQLQQNFFIIFGHFLPFYPPPPLSLTARKKKISKKLKRHLEISSFYTSAPKFMIISYTVPKIWHVTHKFFFIFEYFLLFYTPNSLKKQNFKKWNKNLERSSFYMCTKNYD